MLIAIEAERANSQQKTGVEHYAKQLILHLAEVDRQNTYILFLRHKPEDWFFNLPKNFKVKVMPFPIFWTQIRISWEMWRRPADVLFVPASALPLVRPKNSVITIHDTAWKYFPESFTWFQRNFLNWSTGFASRRAKKIIAVSESTKRDLVKFYGVDSNKVVVVHHGYELENLKLSNENVDSLPEKYVLFLSTLQPRKNLERLIEAFKLLKQENPDLPQKLVVVGRIGWKYGDILKKIQENKDLVVYLNYVNDTDRFAILSKADLLVLPSYYEGFGMQILEAFAQNVPVATSNISSMPEVAGQAAIYFNPSNTQEIKSAIKNVLIDKSLAENLRQKGKERLKEFSWEKAARQTLEVFQNL